MILKATLFMSSQEYQDVVIEARYIITEALRPEGVADDSWNRILDRLPWEEIARQFLQGRANGLTPQQQRQSVIETCKPIRNLLSMLHESEQ